MNTTRQRRWALPITLCALLALPAHAGTTKAAAIETAAAKQERAERLAFIEKQKLLAEERGVAADTQAQPKASAAIVDMPQEEADAPGAVKQ